MVGICCCLGIIIILIVAIVLYCCFSGNSFNNNGQFSFNSRNLFTNTSPDVELMQKALNIGPNHSGTIPSQLTDPAHIQLSNKIVALQGKPINKDLYNAITKPTTTATTAPTTKTAATTTATAPTMATSSPTITSIRNAAANAKAASTSNAGLNSTNFNSLYGNSSGSSFNAAYGPSTYGNISNGNSMMVPMEKIAAAEQELWMANKLSAGQVSMDILNYSGLDLLADTNIDYESYLSNMVIDKRLSSNHNSWVNEMLPWSGTAQSVDNIDEALTNSFSFVGFSRPQAIAQAPSALFQTEADASTFIGNYNPFNKIN